jgi:uncharacterized membrane protein
MGLLDGLDSLSGAPPPNRNGADPLAVFGNGAQSFFGQLGGSVDALSDGLKEGVNSLRRFTGDESADDLEAPTQQQSVADEVTQFFNLTMFQRISLFAMCFATGIVLIFISFSFLPLIMLVPHKFVAAFTMGNVLAIVSTWILVGPRAQLATMFHPVRAAAAAIYVGSLLFALFAAFFGGKLRYILVLVSLIAEVGSCKFAIPDYALNGDLDSCWINLARFIRNEYFKPHILTDIFLFFSYFYFVVLSALAISKLRAIWSPTYFADVWRRQLVSWAHACTL